MTGAEIAWTLTSIHPWSVERPYLYTLKLTLGEQTETIAVGFRQTEFTPDKGFFLNGQSVKLFGVCLHHDLGLLGAAFHEKAAERQLRVMREMGVKRKGGRTPAAGHAGDGRERHPHQPQPACSETAGFV